MASHPNKRIPTASPLLDNDVMTQILRYLPVKSLFRFRTTSKFWRDTVDSPTFRKSHIADNDEDDKVVLVQIKYLVHSTILLDSWKLSADVAGTAPGRIVTSHLNLAGPVNGVICVYNNDGDDIAVANPSLGQAKILPHHPTCTLVRSHSYNIGMGSDVNDYKVVRVTTCLEHRRLHASVYSKATNSWRDLGGEFNKYLRAVEPIYSLGRNDGVTARWLAVRVGREEDLILSFDMKSETFGVIQIPDFTEYGNCRIFAKGDSFVLFSINRDMICNEYEARFEENNNGRLRWHNVRAVLGLDRPPNTEYLRWNNSVVFNNFVFLHRLSNDRFLKLLFYNYADKENSMDCKILPPCSQLRGCELLEYRGSFVSP